METTNFMRSGMAIIVLQIWMKISNKGDVYGEEK